MDWQRAIREERAALMRIANLLLVLANVAELAGSLSPAVRGFVLWLLRHAESVARDFVGGDSVHSHDTWLALMPDLPAGGGLAEAVRLAASLRALARQLAEQPSLVLAVLSKRGGETEVPPFGGMQAMRQVSNALSMPAAFGGLAVHPAPDTS